MMSRPIHVAMNAAAPAPTAPIRGAPRPPKMRTQQSATLITFMTMAAMRCTCVLPMPSKKAFTAMVMAIEMMPSMRQRVYEMAMARTSGTLIISPKTVGNRT
jgi:hypothetical protein